MLDRDEVEKLKIFKFIVEYFKIRNLPERVKIEGENLIITDGDTWGEATESYETEILNIKVKIEKRRSRQRSYHEYSTFGIFNEEEEREYEYESLSMIIPIKELQEKFGITKEEIQNEVKQFNEYYMFKRAELWILVDSCAKRK